MGLLEKLRATERRPRDLLPAFRGAGPLLQRDYWAVIDGCDLRPSEVIAHVRRHFPRFSPEELAAFRTDGRGGLDPGSELEVAIAGAGLAQVRVVHRDAQSFTLATLAGHPEAGRITFGAYRNGRGDVLFHIRSRARSGSLAKYVGFLGAGEAMQTRVWADFVNRVAAATGRGVIGSIHASTREVEDDPDDALCEQPTYLARGD